MHELYKSRQVSYSACTQSFELKKKRIISLTRETKSKIFNSSSNVIQIKEKKNKKRTLSLALELGHEMAKALQRRVTRAGHASSKNQYMLIIMQAFNRLTSFDFTQAVC